MAGTLTRRDLLWRAIGIAPVLALPFGCDEGVRNVLLRGATMGTTWHVTVPALRGVAAEMQARIAAVIADVDAAMSTWRAGSEISRFNRTRSTEWFAVSPATATVVAEAQRISVRTGGAFDITVGPAVDLWGFGAGSGAIKFPDASALAEIRVRVGFQGLDVRQAAIRKTHPGLRIDLSAIAKGYAVDRVAAMLKSDGLSDFMVEIGGEMRCRGRNARGLPWSVAVERPVAGRREPFRILHLSGGALATSGDYRRFAMRDGRRYAHIIDPRSLRPVFHDLGSVTVHDETAMRADALATGLFVLGPREGRRIAVRHRIAALFLVRGAERIQPIATPEFVRRRLFAEGV